LHISKEEQEKRLLDRDAEKAWKLSVSDWKEREWWDQYTEAYEAALTKCSTERAPWYIVPANHKWFRNLAVMERVVEVLQPHKAGWLAKMEQIGEKRKAEIEEYRKQQD
jgi:polyphosphate kinase 2 (PPK2 family)